MKIKIDDYPKQEEFVNQLDLDTTVQKLTWQLEDGSITKETLKTWKAQNVKQLSFIKDGKDDTLLLQNAIYDKLISMEIKQI